MCNGKEEPASSSKTSGKEEPVSSSKTIGKEEPVSSSKTDGKEEPVSSNKTVGKDDLVRQLSSKKPAENGESNYMHVYNFIHNSLDGVLGATIMSAATISMLIALKITNDTFKNIGRYPLTEDEKAMLTKAGFKSEDQKILNNFIREIVFE